LWYHMVTEITVYIEYSEKNESNFTRE
jgi:hypothetical protein